MNVSIIFIILIVINVSHQYEVRSLAEKSKDQVNEFSFEKGLKDLIEKIMREKEVISSASRFCLWKICSRPLRMSRYNSNEKKSQKIVQSDKHKSNVLIRAFYKM